MPEKSPGSTRTSRTRALEIGTNPAGFPDGVSYDPTAGAPVERVGGKYEDQVSGATAPATNPDPSPFKIGGQ